MKRLNAFIILCLIFSNQIQAQDFQTSQISGAGIYHNPALTGAFRAPTFNTLYRNQWPGIDGKYVAFYGAVDAYIEKIKGGLGLFYSNDVAGSGTLRNQYLGLSYAYQANLNDKTKLCFGLSISGIKGNLDWSKLNFGDQIDPRYGFVYQTSEQFGVPVRYNFNINSGLALVNDRYLLSYGANHINTPNVSFLKDSTGQFNKSNIPVRHQINLSLIFLELKHSGLIANIYAARQQDFHQLNLGLAYYLHWFKIGLAYRNKDSMIGLIGGQFKNFRLAYSYDYTVSRLTNATAGSHEVHFTWSLQNRLENGNKCPKVLWNNF